MSSGKRRCRPRYPNGRFRPQTDMILVMGDGDSEKRYFERLSDLCATVSIKAYATGKTGTDVLLRKTREYVRIHRLNPSNGDLVAIVMDLDGRFTESEIKELEQRCRKLGYRLFISNPSFEIWVLCHFRLPTHPYEPNEAVEDLRKELGGTYVKSRGFDIDSRMVYNAMDNARKLLPDGECTPAGCYQHNPSTTDHVLADAVYGKISK